MYIRTFNVRMYNLQEMLQEVRQWGVEPKAFTSDAWYASKANLNLVKDNQCEFLVLLARAHH
jgi:hypothetical protein